MDHFSRYDWALGFEQVLLLYALLTVMLVGVISSRPVTGDEISDLLKDFTNTAVVSAEVISDHLNEARISLDILVPRSVEYFERLVGKEDGQSNIGEYVDSVLI